MIDNCLNCNEKLSGRIDKKYCNQYCKSAHQYIKNKLRTDSFFVKVDKQLKLNRRILKEYNKSGKAIVRKEKLLEEGFNPKYFTHYWKNQKRDVYLFCYEFGFLAKKERNREKYVLIKWQSYMD